MHNMIWVFPLAGVLLGFAASSAFLRLKPVLSKGYTRRNYADIESNDLKVGLFSSIMGLLSILLFAAGYTYFLTLREKAPNNFLVIKTNNRKIIDISTIAPPKSLDDRYNNLETALPEIGKAPILGKPIPVSEELAANEDYLTQREIGANLAVKAAVDVDTIKGPVEIIKSEIIPNPNDYIELSKVPELVKSVVPNYPPICIATQIEGRVFLNLLLDYDGHVLKAEIAKSSGNQALDEAAENAAEQLVFSPAISSTGQPVRVWLAYPFTFSLKK